MNTDTTMPKFFVIVAYFQVLNLMLLWFGHPERPQKSKSVWNNSANMSFTKQVQNLDQSYETDLDIWVGFGGENLALKLQKKFMLNSAEHGTSCL